MRRFLILLILLCSISINVASLMARPKVGVVLSGGGAKGAAHIGALKVIEEAGIPIDIIVGTSMGSIVGGLYSIGYTTSQLDSIFMSQDWPILLSDQTPRKIMNLITHEERSQYVLSVPFFEKPQDIIRAGVIKGRNIGDMLWKLTEGYHDSISFNNMPIPFACVAQDLVTGNEIVQNSGVLPIAIRASMSIPGVFIPINQNGQVLIDGGLVNNYPVDIAKNMGADIIIGVDVRDSLKTEKELSNDVLGQFGQIIDLHSQDRWEQNIRNTDVYIRVNVKGYSTASFNTTAIDSLIDRGERSAREKIKELRKIGRSINAEYINNKEYVLDKRPIPYYYTQKTDITEEQKKAYRILRGKDPDNSMNLGIRFDNEELASLLFNTQMTVGDKKVNALSLTARLGIHAYAQGDYNLKLGEKWKFTTGYRIGYNDFNIYNEGDRTYEVSYTKHYLHAAFLRSWTHSSVRIGTSFNHYNYGSFLYNIPSDDFKDLNKESYMKFGGEYKYNTTDKLYFPLKGNRFAMGAYYIMPFTNNKCSYIGYFHWTGAYSFNSRFTVLPLINARYHNTDNSLAECNTIGGQEYGKYLNQQMIFYGINHFEVAHKILLTTGLELRQRLGSKHYISGIFNLGTSCDEWEELLKKSYSHNTYNSINYIGGALKYDLYTYIGPIGCTIQFSNRNKFSLYVRAGYEF